MSTVEFEAGFIRLLDKLTNGSTIEVNETGLPAYPCKVRPLLHILCAQELYSFFNIVQVQNSCTDQGC